MYCFVPACPRHEDERARRAESARLREENARLRQQNAAMTALVYRNIFRETRIFGAR